MLSSTVNIPRWLAQRAIWLFENDTYGELYFPPEPARYRDFADPQKLVVFSTFDKVIGSEAPYGYVLCRGQGQAMQRQFLERAFRLSPIRQKAIAKLFTSKRIDAHLHKLRGLLHDAMTRMNRLLAEHCAGQFHVIIPQGGACFWLQAAHPVDMHQALEALLAQRIVIVPGELFSQQGAWKQHMRLSYTLDWSKDIAQALQLMAEAFRQSP